MSDHKKTDATQGMPATKKQRKKYLQAKSHINPKECFKGIQEQCFKNYCFHYFYFVSRVFLWTVDSVP